MSIDLSGQEYWLAKKELEQMIIDESGYREPEQKHFKNSYPPVPNIYRKE